MLTPRPLELPDGRSLLREDGLPLMMGIVNITPDSFSDGGEFLDPKAAVSQALKLIEESTDIIDLGAESSRPGAEPLSAHDEWARLQPVLTAVRKESDAPISIDTYHAETAQRALDAGADIINDITAARFDPAMLALCKRSDAPLCLMHMLGDPKTMQENPRYGDVVRDVRLFLKQRCIAAKRAGIAGKRLIVDPGFGFGKTVDHNVELVRNLGRFRDLGLVLMGLSRKSSLIKLSVAAYPDEFHTRLQSEAHEHGNIPADPPQPRGARADSADSPLGASIRSDRRRTPESIAGALISALNGADILRVHEPAATVRALRVGLRMG